MYLVDTNVVSELRRRPYANSGVRPWADAIAEDELSLSVMTVLEIERGVLRMERRDPMQGATLRAWFESMVLPTFAGRILTVDMDVARLAARLHVPAPKPDRDALIAATALVHGLTVVTRNVGDFAGTGVAVLNPWA